MTVIYAEERFRPLCWDRYDELVQIEIPEEAEETHCNWTRLIECIRQGDLRDALKIVESRES